MLRDGLDLANASGVAVSKTNDRDDTVGKQPEESTKERVDRELHELLEETRVVLPGLELLFGFLLILPFSERFAEVDTITRYVYLVCMVMTAAAAALMLATSARHRLGFRKIDKEKLLFIANRHVIAGLILVAISTALAVYLAASVFLAAPIAGVIAGAVALWFVTWWFVLPIADGDC
jgi:hypothetical protein